MTPGQGSLKKATPQEVAAATITAFLRTIPAAVPGKLKFEWDAKLWNQLINTIEIGATVEISYQKIYTQVENVTSSV